MADVTKNSFYDVSQWLTSQKTLARENSFSFVTRQFASS
jgi:hypothetical protein